MCLIMDKGEKMCKEVRMNECVCKCVSVCVRKGGCICNYKSVYVCVERERTREN